MIWDRGGSCRAEKSGDAAKGGKVDVDWEALCGKRGAKEKAETKDGRQGLRAQAGWPDRGWKEGRTNRDEEGRKGKMEVGEERKRGCRG